MSHFFIFKPLPLHSISIILARIIDEWGVWQHILSLARQKRNVTDWITCLINKRNNNAKS